MTSNADHIKWFRDSSPYINAHRGRTFVVCLSDNALDAENLGNVLSDFALLNSLGVRLVLTYCGDSRIKQHLSANGSQRIMGHHRLITTPQHIGLASQALGEINHELSARFSASLPDAPKVTRDMLQRDLQISLGNFVKAKPAGVIAGIDHQMAGDVRAIDAPAINHQLAGNAIVVIPPLGYSPSGETFVLDALELATKVACAIAADKLIYLINAEGLMDKVGALLNEIDLSDVAPESIESDSNSQALLKYCQQACAEGVDRCHVVSFNMDGAILEELFTRDGCGTQIVGHSYEQIRAANSDDVPGILRLIEPLEAAGVLVKRSREHMESEIDRFVVIERDGLLISCAALYEYDGGGELACLVTHPDYRNGDRGDRLLAHIEHKASEHGLNTLFVLTTQSAHWFRERKFTECSIDTLPVSRQDFYNYQRNSVVLSKTLK
ncbi:MAG: amino-acid N-acetyltransferase [Candidatus Azotimanducaceae bacterium]|jgi:amino-acid N-acetyltransferase